MDCGAACVDHLVNLVLEDPTPEPGKPASDRGTSRSAQNSPLPRYHKKGRPRTEDMPVFDRWLADLMVTIHVAYVACVLLGLLVILLGQAVGWRWVGNRWFRSTHLLLIVIVVVRALLTPVCPLTTWEMDFAGRAHEQGFERSAVGLFLHDLIHPQLPLWVFPVIYVLFALLVVAAFWLAPVRWRPDRAAC
jgi:hypothetical protein